MTATTWRLAGMAACMIGPPPPVASGLATGLAMTCTGVLLSENCSAVNFEFATIAPTPSEEARSQPLMKRARRPVAEAPDNGRSPRRQDRRKEVGSGSHLSE